MRVCDLQSGAARLHRAANDLSDRWRETKEDWSDQNCAQFEEEFLRALAPLLRQTRAAIVRFGEIMQDAEDDCVDPDRPECSL